jgi:hypothetical protein
VKQFFFLVFFLSVGIACAQQSFTLRLEASSITSAPAIHSGAFGSYNNKWFFIGGRKNGLHSFQTPFAFLPNGVNDSIFFVDPATNQCWSASTYLLADSIREAITSSNMEFYLSDSILYMVGGYGWKDALQNFITWPTLTAINLSGLTYAVINGLPIANYFRQIADSNLAICGAHLQKMDSVYYLVFGHRFDGRYDKTDTSGFNVQVYSNEIRKFQIADDGANLSLYNYSAIRDTANFRRRDYNLIPFIDPFRGEGLLAFSGVFQPHINLPYLNPIEIYKDTVIIRTDFNQNLNQYHSAVCALYDSVDYLQHNVFFGGISMYYVDTVTQQTITDSLVPFVRTISDVARDIDFTYHEFRAGIRMPSLLGTNAYFLNDLNVPLYRKHFINLNMLPYHQRIGYIVGGIESLDLNIADNDPSVMSHANATVWEVYLDATDTVSGFQEVNNDVLNFFCYPNPAKNEAKLEFELKRDAQVKIELADMKGAIVKMVCNRPFVAGKQKLLLNLSDLTRAVYNCVLTVNNHRKSIRLAKE